MLHATASRKCGGSKICIDKTEDWGIQASIRHGPFLVVAELNPHSSSVTDCYGHEVNIYSFWHHVAMGRILLVARLIPLFRKRRKKRRLSKIFALSNVSSSPRH